LRKNKPKKKYWQHWFQVKCI